jgi:hypothetical protein
MSSLTLQSLDVSSLRGEFSGALELPGEPGYELARQPWNLAFEQRPALVAHANTPADVAAVLRFAAERGLRVAPQGTGHGAPRVGPLEQSILLRTDGMRGVQIDTTRRVARVDAGALWSDLAAASGPVGLSGLGGSVPDVGVVAFALGGGLGWLSRAHGLCCHRLRAVELVTPARGWMRCDATHQPELFWALRGGGGDLGVVTAIELELVPAPALYGGTMLWPWDRAAEVLHAWRRWTDTVPETVTTAARLLQVPPTPDVPAPLRGRQFVTVGGAITGTPAEATALLEPLRALGPEIDLFAPTDPEGLQRLHLEPEQPVPALSTHALLNDLAPHSIDALLAAAGPGCDSHLLSVEVRHLGGAVATEQFGALSRLTEDYLLFAVGVPFDAPAGAIDEELGGVRAAVSDCTSSVEYLNFGDAPDQLGRSLPPETMHAIARGRALTDPDGVMHRA